MMKLLGYVGPLALVGIAAAMEVVIASHPESGPARAAARSTDND